MKEKVRSGENLVMNDGKEQSEQERDENNNLEMDMVMFEVKTNNGRIEAKEKTIETMILGDSDRTTLT